VWQWPCACENRDAKDMTIKLAEGSVSVLAVRGLIPILPHLKNGLP